MECSASAGDGQPPPRPTFQEGDLVEYWSETYTMYMNAVVQKVHYSDASVISYDLDVKAKAHPSKVRLPEMPPASPLMYHDSDGRPVGDDAIESECGRGVFKGQAERKSFGGNDSISEREKAATTYSAARPRFQVGERVEYQSSTHKQWMPATVLEVNSDGETYNLDVKKMAQPARMRRITLLSEAEAASVEPLARPASASPERQAVERQAPERPAVERQAPELQAPERQAPERHALPVVAVVPATCGPAGYGGISHQPPVASQPQQQPQAALRAASPLSSRAAGPRHTSVASSPLLAVPPQGAILTQVNSPERSGARPVGSIGSVHSADATPTAATPTTVAVFPQPVPLLPPQHSPQLQHSSHPQHSPQPHNSPQPSPQHSPVPQHSPPPQAAQHAGQFFLSRPSQRKSGALSSSPTRSTGHGGSTTPPRPPAVTARPRRTMEPGALPGAAVPGPPRLGPPAGPPAPSLLVNAGREIKRKQFSPVTTAFGGQGLVPSLTPAIGSGQAVNVADLQVGSEPFAPMQPPLRNQLLAKLGLPSTSSVRAMEGFRGGLNEGIWFVTSALNSQDEFVLKLVKSSRSAQGVLTEAESLLKIQREHPQVLKDPILSFPLKIFSCVGPGGIKKNDLIVMRRVKGTRLADWIGEKWYSPNGSQVAQVMEAIERAGAQLADFHVRYGGTQHGDFSPSNIFYDEERGGICFIDIGGMGVPTSNSDRDHFMKSIHLLAETYGQQFAASSAHHFEQGYQRTAAEGRHQQLQH